MRHATVLVPKGARAYVTDCITYLPMLAEKMCGNYSDVAAYVCRSTLELAYYRTAYLALFCTTVCSARSVLAEAYHWLLKPPPNTSNPASYYFFGQSNCSQDEPTGGRTQPQIRVCFKIRLEKTDYAPYFPKRSFQPLIAPSTLPTKSISISSQIVNLSARMRINCNC